MIGSLHTLSRKTMRPAYPSIPVGEDARALMLRPEDESVFVLDSDGSYTPRGPENGRSPGHLGSGLFGEHAAGVMSPDGTRMVVPGPGLRVRLLDVETHTFVGKDSSTPWGDRPTFAPDGSQFGLVQGERVGLWDGHTGEYQASLPLPSRVGTYSITYRSDSSGLVIASTDGRTWTADTRTNTWVERACAIAGRNLTDDEWSQFFPSRPYEPTCPQWPSAG